MPESCKCSRPGGKAWALPGPGYCSAHRPGGVPGLGAPRRALKARKHGLYARKLAHKIQDLKPFWTSLPRSLVGRNGRIADFDGCGADFDGCGTDFNGCSADSWLVQMSMVVFSPEGRNTDTESKSIAQSMMLMIKIDGCSRKIFFANNH
jgi:hypothetical protein